MEKIANRSINDFPAATLYLDDLEEIAKLLSIQCNDLTITAGEYKITDISEIDDLASKFLSGRFDSVRLKGNDPYITIDFLPSGISAYISNDSLENLGFITKVRNIIASRKKRNPISIFTILMYVALTFAVFHFVISSFIIGGMLIAISLGIIPFSIIDEMRNKVIVYSTRQSETKTFFERKKDDIAVSGISGLIGALLGYGISKLLP